MRVLMLAAMGMMLVGCAASVISSNERSVIIMAGTVMVGQAQVLADSECKKYGRFARLSMKNTPSQYVFDCVN